MDYLLNDDDKEREEKENAEIKRKVITNDEGDEALADFLYDKMIDNNYDYKEDYKDYRDD